MLGDRSWRGGPLAAGWAPCRWWPIGVGETLERCGPWRPRGTGGLPGTGSMVGCRAGRDDEPAKPPGGCSRGIPRRQDFPISSPHCSRSWRPGPSPGPAASAPILPSALGVDASLRGGGRGGLGFRARQSRSGRRSTGRGRRSLLTARPTSPLDTRLSPPLFNFVLTGWEVCMTLRQTGVEGSRRDSQQPPPDSGEWAFRRSVGVGVERTPQRNAWERYEKQMEARPCAIRGIGVVRQRLR